jgi:hypothetical protein
VHIGVGGSEAVPSMDHGSTSTALGGVESGSGSHWVVRWFRLPTAQQLPGLVLLSSLRGIWCGLGGSSVRSTADPHMPTPSHTHCAYKACCAPTRSHTHTACAVHTHDMCMPHAHPRAAHTQRLCASPATASFFPLRYQDFFGGYLVVVGVCVRV